jgi:8-oxo-dGTP pyrophosphatase MutT (NUDIX family)
MGEEGLSFEPQKFFIGIIDFFAILLPGALLAYVLRMRLERLPDLNDRVQRLEGVKGWVAFLVASYMLGHLAFLLGSWLDEPYDWLRGRTLDQQIRQLARSQKTFGWWVRALVWLVFKREDGSAVELAGKIKRQSLAKINGRNSINNFQWCKAFLTLESSKSLAVVQRLEADSKFFRCFVVVLLVVLIFLLRDGLGNGKWKIAIVLLVLIPLALWRYMEQRFKATNQAYWSVITLTGAQEKITIKPASQLAGLTHAGGVVFRERGLGEREYLLVEPSKTAGEWVLPKGKIEGDEDIRETAIREVHEETGVWAKIVRPEHLADSSYIADQATVSVRFFLMEPVARGFPSDRWRQHSWLTLKDAEEGKKCHPQTIERLNAAEPKMQAAPKAPPPQNNNDQSIAGPRSPDRQVDSN